MRRSLDCPISIKKAPFITENRTINTVFSLAIAIASSQSLSWYGLLSVNLERANCILCQWEQKLTKDLTSITS